MESSGIADEHNVKKFSAVAWLRILGCVAVIHAVALLFGLAYLQQLENGAPRLALSIGADSSLSEVVLLWVGLAMLWFLWPIVLALHPAQSAWRVLIPLGVAAPFVFFWFRWWSLFWGPQAFGLPQAGRLTPLGVVRCAYFYTSGYVEAQLAIRKNEIALEGYGFGFSAPRAPNFSEEERQRCGIKNRAVSGCIIDDKITSHAYGWNDATMSALRRRCPDIVKAAEQRDAEWEQSWHDGRRDGQTDATNDIRAGVLAIEVDVSPDWKDDDFERLLRQQYQIGMRRIDPRANEKMANRISGHQHGYNEVAEAEIEKRLGKGKIKEIWSNRIYDPKRRD